MQDHGPWAQTFTTPDPGPAPSQEIEQAVFDARAAVSEAVKEGLEAVEKAVQEGRKKVKEAHREVPLIHDSRLGDQIDDPWTIPRLLELALAEPGQPKREIPGCDGDLGPFPFADIISKKELRLVSEAATEFIKLVQAAADESLEEIIKQELDEDQDQEGIIMDQIFSEHGIRPHEISAVARTFSRRRFGEDKAVNSNVLQGRMRQYCLNEICDPDTKLGRKSRELVHNLSDLTVDLGMKHIEWQRRGPPLPKPDDSHALAQAAAAEAEAQDSGAPDTQRKFKAARTSTM